MTSIRIEGLDSKQDFLNWLKSLPSDTTFSGNANNCPIATYLKYRNPQYSDLIVDYQVCYFESGFIFDLLPLPLWAIKTSKTFNEGAKVYPLSLVIETVESIED